LELAARARRQGWVLFPTSDASAAMIARHHETLGAAYALATPPWPVLRWAHDKRRTYALAARLGIPHPATWTAAGPDEAAALPVTFPAIIKPAVKEAANALTVAKAWRVDGAAELRARFAE